MGWLSDERILRKRNWQLLSREDDEVLLTRE